MATTLPPPPYGAENNSYIWMDWYNLYRESLQTTSDAVDEVTATVDLFTEEGVGIPSGASNPGTGTEGALFFNTTDGKLYRYYSGAWTAAVPAVDVTGQLTDAQLEAIAAAKLTGQITTTQITDDAITTPKIFAGAVTTNEIAANTIVAANIAAAAITATEIAAGAIEADKIAANAVTSDKIIANAITAGKILASAVESDKIAANAVTADKISVTDLAAINAELGSAVISTTGSLRSGQTAYNTGTGWWIGYDSGVPKFSIGVSGGNRLTFDGTTLEVTLDTTSLVRTGIQPVLSTGVGGFVLGATGTATATQYFYDDGSLRYQQNGGSITVDGNWYTPTTTSIGSSYWIRFTKVSEVLETPTGTFNTWLALSSPRNVSLSRTTVPGEAEAVIKVDISTDSSGSPIVSTGFITLSATREL